MGKKVKKKTKNASGQRDRRFSSGSLGSGPKPVIAVKSVDTCNHTDAGVNPNKVSESVQWSNDVRCEDCKNSGEKRGKDGRGKHSRSNKGPTENLNAKSTWVCLACGHFACGGQKSESTPQSHALRHWKWTHHPYTVRWGNPQHCWCFSCNSWISCNENEGDVTVGEEESEEKSKKIENLSEVIKLIKKRSCMGSRVDAEDVWFGGSVKEENHGGNGESIVSDAKKELRVGKGYLVRGLVNLGNTCFFNSVMQNLLALDTVRDYFVNLNQSIGPLTLSLKRFFNETGVESLEEYKDSKNGINPKSFFGCICSKAPQFRGYQQQDSHELLRYLLDGLSAEELGARKLAALSKEGGELGTTNSGATFVDGVFGGQLSSTVCCVECGHLSVVYEPFLDLSVPVPTKKPTAKKAASRPKRASGSVLGKLSLKEGNKGQKYREKGSFNTNETPTVAAQCAAEESNVRPEVSESCSAPISGVSVMEERVALEEDFSWMDYIRPATVSDDTSCNLNSEDMQGVDGCSAASFAESAPQDECESGGARLKETNSNNLVTRRDNILSMKNTNTASVFHNQDALPCRPEPQDGGTVPLSLEDSRSDAYCGTQPKVGCESSSENCLGDELPLMVKDSEILLLPYKEEDVTVADTLEATTTSVVGCGQTEEDFDGLGDLFNEPQTVQTNEEFGTVSELETALLAGNSSESNQDEVDDMDARVSIDSCLAYFTKPELLSGEHAWICESCSKALESQKRFEIKDSGDQDVTLKNGSKILKSRDNRDSLGLLKDSSGSAKPHILVNQNSETLVADGESLNDTNANGEQKLLSSIGESEGSKFEFGQMGSEKEVEILNPLLNGPSHKQENSQSSDCLEVGSSSADANDLSRHSETRNKVDQAMQKRSRVLGRANKLDSRKATKMECDAGKVKRDATKRILINKAPLILTIHLKRFSQDARGRLSKLSGHVSFQETLDLRPYMDPRCVEKDECRYRLVGVVEHSGTMKGGHYVAYIRGERGRGKSMKESSASSWFYASDLYVREVSLMEVLQSEAYILFYEKN